MALPTLNPALGSQGEISTSWPSSSRLRCSRFMVVFSRLSASTPLTLPPASSAPRMAALSIPLAPPRYECPSSPSRQPTYRHRVVDQRVVHMARTDHGEAARLQQGQIAAA